MPTVNIWTSNDSGCNNEKEFRTISNWWSELEGKKIKWDSMQGVSVTATGYVQEMQPLPQDPLVFVIKEPKLEGNMLSFKAQEITNSYEVFKLELTDMKELKVFYLDNLSPNYFYFTFTLISEGQSSAYFKII